MNESRLWCPDPAAAAQACAAQYPQDRAHTLEIADEICQHIFYLPGSLGDGAGAHARCLWCRGLLH